jgi:hypothetical protein
MDQIHEALIANDALIFRGQVSIWPFASFRGRAAISSLLERSGHQPAGRADWFGPERPKSDLPPRRAVDAELIALKAAKQRMHE